MTNTHINVGGHKITTNKVGSKHYTEALSSGFTGGIQWCVTNGICVMSMIGVQPGSTGGSQVVLNGIPKPKIYAYTSDGTNSFWIIEDTNVLYANANAIYQEYLTLVYPVADDWVES